MMLHNNVKQIEVSCLLFSSFQSQTPEKVDIGTYRLETKNKILQLELFNFCINCNALRQQYMRLSAVSIIIS